MFGARVSRIQTGTVHIDAAVAKDDEYPRVQWYQGDFRGMQEDEDQEVTYMRQVAIRQAQETMEHAVEVSDNPPFLACGPSGGKPRGLHSFRSR
jgi:hypothetical protein